MNTFDFQVRHTSCVCRITKYIGKIKSNTTCLMVLLLICSYIASLNDMFRPFHGPSSGWSIFARQKWVIIRLIIFCKAKLSHLQVDHFLQGKIESSSGWLFFARQKWAIFRLITFCKAKLSHLQVDYFLQGKSDPSSGWSFFARQKWVIFRLIIFCKAKVSHLPVDHFCKAKRDQPEDGLCKGRNISLREVMWEHLSNKTIKQVVFDFILPIYFVNIYELFRRA